MALRGRLQGLLRRLQDRVGPITKETASKPSRRRIRQSQHQQTWQQHHSIFRGPGTPTSRTVTGLDVARFGLLSIATLPFTLWVAAFTYSYDYRIGICKDALAQEDDEIAYLRSKSKRKSKVIGKARQRQLAEVQALLSRPPHQIMVVAGTNESGKSRFVEEILKSLPLSRGVTYIHLAQIVDSLSTLTHAFVRAFDLRWLSMRHSLVDVLPFAGSEILVMKERFSDRDLTQALLVITEALKCKAATDKDLNNLPVIFIDGLGEGSAWTRSPEGQRAIESMIKWCIYITKERKLAHVVLTGNEELVISLTGQNRLTRGHVKVVGLDDLSMEDAAKIVLQELPDASEEEIRKITDIFGGFIHDVQAVSREIQSWLNYRASDGDDQENVDRREAIFEHVLSSRFRMQLERVTAAFAKGRSESEEPEEAGAGNEEDDDDMDPYLDPLKAIYSEAEAQKESEAMQESAGSLLSDSATWSQLQLWQTLLRLVATESMKVPFADLRDDVFEGNMTPLLGLMNEDVLGFEVESSSGSGWSWAVKPATPAVGRVFKHLVDNSHLKERFQEIQKVNESREQLEEIERERRKLRRERKRLDVRKASLLNTVELEKELRVRTGKELHKSLQDVYCSLVKEEVANEQRGLELRKKLESISKANAAAAEKDKRDADYASIQKHLKAAILQRHTQEVSKDKFAKFRHAFAQLTRHTTHHSEGGLTAEDVVQLIKTTSGEDVDLEAAKSFIQKWDLNQDKRLSYDEFVSMLLTDREATKRLGRINKKQ